MKTMKCGWCRKKFEVKDKPKYKIGKGPHLTAFCSSKCHTNWLNKYATSGLAKFF